MTRRTVAVLAGLLDEVLRLGPLEEGPDGAALALRYALYVLEAEGAVDEDQLATWRSRLEQAPAIAVGGTRADVATMADAADAGSELSLPGGGALTLTTLRDDGEGGSELVYTGSATEARRLAPEAFALSEVAWAELADDDDVITTSAFEHDSMALKQMWRVAVFLDDAGVRHGIVDAGLRSYREGGGPLLIDGEISIRPPVAPGQRLRCALLGQVVGITATTD